MPVASLIRMGMFGLFFFIVGYARFRNDLSIAKEGLAFDPGALRKFKSMPYGESGTYLVASLAGDEWHRWKRTSLRLEVKAYLLDIVDDRGRGR
jgi:hypothetical protein